ncbi:alpha-L-glutamate ligase-like protein [Echinimonas agarilytica]|uniref:Alpha-L-glutamate ligase-like protein n=1 Tax=Echinimonas agarilytica TaxID=1215918 RepID=A0AA41W7A3_9GAMM|nr:alpha-L-glutamate ligase-like protein [Echinimonas agarilytica]MCM2679754.1 alpha-L-glutamate ligase-like protein [Echinimonas agarilytica]
MMGLFRKLSDRGMLGMNRRNISYIGRYNERSKYPLVDDKRLTKQIAVEANLNVPNLLAVVDEQSKVRSIHQMVQGHEGFVIKPAKGSGGKGILVILRRDGDNYVKSNGDVVSRSDVERHLSNTLSGLFSLGGTPDVAVVEALIDFDPAFADYSFEGVPDIRIIIFQGFPVMAMMRLATRASDGKANLHQGAVGVGLDIAQGKTLRAVQYNQPVKHHPDTGAELAQLNVPHWRTMLDLAAGCYDITGLGYMGADIVLDQKKGPMLLELNARPGLSIQIANGEGLLPRLRHIEQSNLDFATVKERVDYAVENFTN